SVPERVHADDRRAVLGAPPAGRDRLGAARMGRGERAPRPRALRAPHVREEARASRSLGGLQEARGAVAELIGGVSRDGSPFGPSPARSVPAHRRGSAARRRRGPIPAACYAITYRRTADERARAGSAHG